jgi:hypothetical protein
VAVFVSVGVAVIEGTAVFVGVRVGLAVEVGRRVRVGIGVRVGVTVKVFVTVGVGEMVNSYSSVLTISPWGSANDTKSKPACASWAEHPSLVERPAYPSARVDPTG